MMKSKKSNYRFWHSPIALAIIFLVLVWFSYKIIFLIEKQKETTYKKEQYLDEISRLKDKESLLAEQLLRIETEEGIEEVIRSKYQVTKSGEKMVTIVDENENIESNTEKENTGHGLWNFIKNIFN